MKETEDQLDLIECLTIFYDQEVSPHEDYKLTSRISNVLPELLEMKNSQVKHNETTAIDKPLLNPWYVQPVSRWNVGHITHFIFTFINGYYNPERPPGLMKLFLTEDEEKEAKEEAKEKLNNDDIIRLKSEMGRIICFLSSKYSYIKEIFHEVISSKLLSNQDSIQSIDFYIDNYHYPYNDCFIFHDAVNELFLKGNLLLDRQCELILNEETGKKESSREHVYQWIIQRDIEAFHTNLCIPLLTSSMLMIIHDTKFSLITQHILNTELNKPNKTPEEEEMYKILTSSDLAEKING